jgi:hypothetical protein
VEWTGKQSQKSHFDAASVKEAAPPCSAILPSIDCLDVCTFFWCISLYAQEAGASSSLLWWSWSGNPLLLRVRGDIDLNVCGKRGSIESFLNIFRFFSSASPIKSNDLVG